MTVNISFTEPAPDLIEVLLAVPLENIHTFVVNDGQGSSLSTWQAISDLPCCPEIISFSYPDFSDLIVVLLRSEASQDTGDCSKSAKLLSGLRKLQIRGCEGFLTRMSQDLVHWRGRGANLKTLHLELVFEKSKEAEEEAQLDRLAELVGILRLKKPIEPSPLPDNSWSWNTLEDELGMGRSFR